MQKVYFWQVMGKTSLIFIAHLKHNSIQSEYKTTIVMFNFSLQSELKSQDLRDLIITLINLMLFLSVLDTNTLVQYL